jgi:hypothetical protein
MVGEVKAGRNSAFQANVDELLRSPWHWEDVNGHPVYYDPLAGIADLKLGMVR